MSGCSITFGANSVAFLNYTFFQILGHCQKIVEIVEILPNCMKNWVKFFHYIPLCRGVYSENWNSTGAEIRVLDGDILKIIKNADWNNDVVSEEQFVI